MAERSDERKRRKKGAIIGVLISALVLGGGYGAYAMMYGPEKAPTKSSTSVKHKTTVKHLFGEDDDTDGDTDSKAAKKVVEDSGNTTLDDTGSYSTGLFGDGISGLQADLDSSASEHLASLAKAATKAQAKEAAAKQTPVTTTTIPNAGVVTPPVTTPGTGIGAGTDTGAGAGTGTTGEPSNPGTTVTNANPVLTLTQAGVLKLHLKQADFDPAAGVTASDAEDGDLTDKIEVKATTVNLEKTGLYTITYTVTDSAGNTATINRLVLVSNDAPEIDTGDSDTVEINGSFDPRAGVSASDYQDGDLTAKITVVGSVDTTKPGENKLTYTVTDSNGRTATKERTVTVTATKPTLNVSKVKKTAKVGDAYDAAGATSTSPYGAATVTHSGTVDTTKPGDNVLTYVSTDVFGQTTTKKVTVVVSADKPKLDVSKVPTTVEEGATFKPRANVKVTSAYGEATFTVKGKVDTSTVGSYVLTYTAKDKFDQTLVKKVTVEVVAKSTEA